MSWCVCCVWVLRLQVCLFDLVDLMCWPFSDWFWMVITLCFALLCRGVLFGDFADLVACWYVGAGCSWLVCLCLVCIVFAFGFDVGWF